MLLLACRAVHALAAAALHGFRTLNAATHCAAPLCRPAILPCSSPVAASPSASAGPGAAPVGRAPLPVLGRGCGRLVGRPARRVHDAGPAAAGGRGLGLAQRLAAQRGALPRPVLHLRQPLVGAWCCCCGSGCSERKGRTANMPTAKQACRPALGGATLMGCTRTTTPCGVPDAQVQQRPLLPAGGRG